MRTSFDLHYDPLPDGGTTVRITHESVELSLPLDRQTVLNMAASILGCAGVSEAAFTDGRLVVLSSDP